MPSRISPPIYLRLTEPIFTGATISLREHLPDAADTHAESDKRPLLLITFHPGFVTGSYGRGGKRRHRDYFERLSPYLFDLLQQRYRLRIFTVNHPGYDLPLAQPLDHLHTLPYSIEQQPAAIAAALQWLLHHMFAPEPEIHLLAYGHSMGGLALSRHDLQSQVTAVARSGRSLTVTKVLAAPALFLNPLARAGIARLDTLHALKLTLGRLPLYRPVATAIYRAFAPLFFERDGPTFSLDVTDDFYDFDQLNPFVLLEQGRELLRLEAKRVGGPALLANANLILAEGDEMIDVAATAALAQEAQRQGYAVNVHKVHSTHLLERAAPAAVAQIVAPLVTQDLARRRHGR